MKILREIIFNGSRMLVGIWGRKNVGRALMHLFSLNLGLCICCTMCRATSNFNLNDFDQIFSEIPPGNCPLYGRHRKRMCPHQPRNHSEESRSRLIAGHVASNGLDRLWKDLSLVVTRSPSISKMSFTANLTPPRGLSFA